MLSVDPARPLPLLVDGSALEWDAAASVAACRAVETMPVATIAVVRGDPPATVRTLLRQFDLRAAVLDEHREDPGIEVAGPEAEVAAALDQWCRGFRRSPQACTVAARLLRMEQPSPLAESLAYSTLQSGREHAAWLAARSAGTPPSPTPGPGDSPDQPPGGPVARPPNHGTNGPHGIAGERTCIFHGRRVCVLEGDGLREVVLRRGGRHNAMDVAMREELCDVVDALAASDGAIVLRGDGPSFCSGGDLDEFGTLEDPAHAHLVRTSRSVAERLHQVSGRLLVAVHGACVGAGVELAAFGAWVIAAQSARFRLPEASFGLLPGAGGTVSLPPRVGRHRLLDWIVTGRWVDAATAWRCGLVDELVEPARLEGRLHELAHGGFP